MSSLSEPKTGAALAADFAAFCATQRASSSASSAINPGTPSLVNTPSKVVPPHPLSPPAAPPAKRQKSGTPSRAPTVDPPSGSPEPSVFDVLNIFQRRWFLHWDHLIANVLSATKDDAGHLDWVDFQPPFHTHLVH